ncbi:hypothetical protein TNCT_69001 [Trichonephila clavata]|uniref:Uncharacterized protein n=1 Tax=Trichonephila clavata TaxID=2740835 RepID=A0A8X6JC22_TRICU|nr:hypothetical protein TNCT_69001 [Trichonephila clavata]
MFKQLFISLTELTLHSQNPVDFNECGKKYDNIKRNNTGAADSVCLMTSASIPNALVAPWCAVEAEDLHNSTFNAEAMLRNEASKLILEAAASKET